MTGEGQLSTFPVLILAAVSLYELQRCRNKIILVFLGLEHHNSQKWEKKINTQASMTFDFFK